MGAYKFMYVYIFNYLGPWDCILKIIFFNFFFNHFTDFKELHIGLKVKKITLYFFFLYLQHVSFNASAPVPAILISNVLKNIVLFDRVGFK